MARVPFQEGAIIFLKSTVSTPVLVLKQTFTKWLTGTLSQKIKQLGSARYQYK
jgi:hypothetical protein